VPAEDLAALYATATVFAYPSLYEGFGLPILEAMAAGTPVLTSNVSSMPEVAGDAALLCDPTSVDSIADGLRRLLSDAALRAQLAERGRAREAQFTWERTADLTMQSYHRALAQP
jgi:glycosyltransferase involved in cell wall biosynthesis